MKCYDRSLNHVTIDYSCVNSNPLTISFDGIYVEVKGTKLLMCRIKHRAVKAYRGAKV